MSEALRIEILSPPEITNWDEVAKLRFEELDRRYRWNWSTPSERDLNPQARHILAYRGEEYVGGGRLTPDETPGAEAGRWLVGRFVAKYQHQGIGTEMYRATENEAKQQGATSLILESVPEPETIKFYKKRGYEKTGIKEAPNIDGGVVECTVMVKELTNVKA